MFDWLSKRILAIALALSGALLLVAPVLFGTTFEPSAELSGAVIGVVLILAGVGLGYGSLDFWSRLALGVGTWTLVTPILFGFDDRSPSFWSHMLAGLIALIVGVGGHELMARRKAPLAEDRS